jgi:tetratricopeptide (TPR) repeat protein
MLIATLMLAPTAHADEATTRAKALFEVGMKHYQVGEYKEALESFKAGYFAKRNPAFLFNMGQCYRMQGDLDGELREYRAYLRESPDANNRADVEQFIAEAEKEQARRQVEKAAASAPAAAQPAPVAPTPEPAPRRRWWIGVVVGVAALAVAAGVTAAVVVTHPPDAPSHSGVDTVGYHF